MGLLDKSLVICASAAPTMQLVPAAKQVSFLLAGDGTEAGHLTFG